MKDTGYDVWLRYDAPNENMRSIYERRITRAAVLFAKDGSCNEVLDSAANELSRALPRLLQKPFDVVRVPFAESANADTVGTAAASTETADSAAGLFTQTLAPCLVASLYETLPPQLKAHIADAEVPSVNGGFCIKTVHVTQADCANSTNGAPATDSAQGGAASVAADSVLKTAATSDSESTILFNSAATSDSSSVPDSASASSSSAQPQVPYTVICARNACGVLYGTFAFLRLLQQQKPIDALALTDSPKCAHRMLNHWDNLDGSIERGYAGKTLWQWRELPKKVSARYTDYARMCASVGINAAALNNVNTQCEVLSTEYLQKVAAIAAVLRRYGIKTFLSVNFASPMVLGGLPSADPCDAAVNKWWSDKTDEVYRLIPDFGGYLVKADSEGQLGPYAYNRTHADGANMFASVLAKHGGKVIWRAFVYGQGESDRAKKAYADFKPLDGAFKENVAIQVKNGAIDFQPREPVHPLFGAMPNTSLYMEFQIAQEYLGQGNHLVFLAPMWKEILDFDTYANGEGSTVGKTLCADSNAGIAAVSNTGSNPDWCGSLFHPANLYAFGRLSWNYELSSEEIAREWALCTWGSNPKVLDAVLFILLNSWNACVDYMTPLGLHHIMKYHHHYGPDPACDEGAREDWKPRYYHRADGTGLGFDRTQNGSDAVSQYAPPVASVFANIETCPEKYLLWFHHVPWQHKMASGRTLKDELVFRYERGVEEAQQLLECWERVKGDVEKSRYKAVLKKLKIQVRDAHEWRDVCVPYFMSFAENR